MALIPFSEISDNARIWIFATPTPIDSVKLPQFEREANAILDKWQAHGKDLTASMELRHARFLIIAADEDHEKPSGCSIDTLTREIAQLGQKFDARFLGEPMIYYKQGSDINVVSRGAFKSLVNNGEVTVETIVFNNALTSIDQFRAGEWEVPVSKSWHAKAFAFGVSS